MYIHVGHLYATIQEDFYINSVLLYTETLTWLKWIVIQETSAGAFSCIEIGSTRNAQLSVLSRCSTDKRGIV